MLRPKCKAIPIQKAMDVAADKEERRAKKKKSAPAPSPSSISNSGSKSKGKNHPTLKTKAAVEADQKCREASDDGGDVDPDHASMMNKAEKKAAPKKAASKKANIVIGLVNRVGLGRGANGKPISRSKSSCGSGFYKYYHYPFDWRLELLEKGVNVYEIGEYHKKIFLVTVKSCICVFVWSQSFLEVKFIGHWCSTS